MGVVKVAAISYPRRPSSCTRFPPQACARLHECKEHLRLTSPYIFTKNLPFCLPRDEKGEGADDSLYVAVGSTTPV